jgi:hypothetical protein
MALSKKAAKQIATTVNGIMCAQLMRDAMVEKGDKAGQYMWFAREYEQTIELADKFGIELPALYLARANAASMRAMYDQLTLVG